MLTSAVALICNRSGQRLGEFSESRTHIGLFIRLRTPPAPHCQVTGGGKAALGTAASLARSWWYKASSSDYLLVSDVRKAVNQQLWSRFFRIGHGQISVIFFSKSEAAIDGQKDNGNICC